MRACVVAVGLGERAGSRVAWLVRWVVVDAGKRVLAGRVGATTVSALHYCCRRVCTFSTERL